MRLLAIAIGLLLGSCYASHTSSGSSDTERERGDGGRVDASTAVRDAGAASDAEAPLPPEAVHDPGPDGRPSDDPAADDWEDPPSVDPEDPCCVSTGRPTEIPLGSRALGDLTLEWNGSGWGLLTSTLRFAAFQELAADGSRLGPLRRLAVSGGVNELVWSGGRFGTVISAGGNEPPPDKSFALLDRRGVVATGWVDLWPYLPSIQASLARVEHRNRWFVVEGHGAPTIALELDSEGVVVAERQLADFVTAGPKIVGLKSRAVVFYNGPVGPDGLYSVVLEPGLEEVEPIRLSGDPSGVVAATRLRDTAVAITRGAAGEGTFSTLDPFTGETRVAAVDALPRVRTAEGMDRHDLIAICGQLRLESERDLTLSLYDRQGQRVGAPVRVAENYDGRGCAIGVDGAEIHIGWNDRWGERIMVSHYRIRGAD